MPNFSFSFLLATPYKPDLKPKKPKKEKKSKKKFKEEELPPIEKDYTEYEVKKPTFYCHLEYVILPNSPACNIDIVCWDKIARVYHDDNIHSVHMYEISDLLWIYFKVQHDVELTDVPSFYKHYITVTIRPDKKKLGAKAKGDKPKLFYGPKLAENDDRKRMFQSVAEDIQVMRLLTDKENENGDNIRLDLMIENNPLNVMLQNMIYRLDKEYHDPETNKIPTFQDMDELPPFKNLKEVITAKKKEKPSKIKKEKKGKSKKEVDLQYKLSGELFLSGIPVFTRCLKYRAIQLPYCFNVITVKNVLTREQAKLYKPFSVTINHINDLPVASLNNIGVEEILLKYDICGEIAIETRRLSIEKDMNLDITRTILTNNFNPIALLEFLKTNGLRIIVEGVLPKKDTQSVLCKPEMLQVKHQRPKRKIEPQERVFLGTAVIDISSVLMEPYRVQLTYNFRRPVDNLKISCDKHKEGRFQRMINTNEVNAFYATEKIYNECHHMFNSGTVITLSVRLCHPVFDIMRSITNEPSVFNRLFIVLYNFDLAARILHCIQCQVEEMVSPINMLRSGTKVKRPLTSYTKLREKESSPTVNLTGFLIDCVDKIMIYTESASMKSIQHIWMQVSHITTEQGHVLYDSSRIFCHLSHADLAIYGGFYIVSLREPPSIILSKPLTYVEGNIPIPAWKALMSVELLSNCPSIRTACADNLFPDTNCLLSLDTEFGVPMSMYEKDKPYPEFSYLLKESSYSLQEHGHEGS